MRTITAVACALLLASCFYDVPLTREPTRAADPQLAGTWTMVSPEKGEEMVIRLDGDRRYVIEYDSGLHGITYRAFHTEVAGMPLISVEVANERERKWVVLDWKLEGERLTIRAVNPEVVPPGDRESLVKAILANRDNPKLFREEPAVYER